MNWVLFRHGRCAGWTVALLAAAIGATRTTGAQPAAPALSMPAHVEPFEKAALLAKRAGFVARVRVDIGDHVAQGDILAELSIPEMYQERRQQEALVAQANAGVSQAASRVTSAAARIRAAEAQLSVSKAQLARHQADIDFATSELSRIRELVSGGALNQAMQDEKRQQLQAAQAAFQAAEAGILSAASLIDVEHALLQQAQADLAAAQANQDVAKAALAHTETMMEYATLTAPFAGLITHRGIDHGDFVMSGTPRNGNALFLLQRVDRFRIVFDIPESAARTVRKGQGVVLRVDSVREQEFTGEVARTAGALDPRTRTVRAEAEVRDPDHLLMPGMYGTISVTLDPPP